MKEVSNPLRRGDKVVVWGFLRPGDYEFELEPSRELVQAWVEDSGAEVIHELIDSSAPDSPESEELHKRVCVIGREHNACLVVYGADEDDFLFFPSQRQSSRLRRGKNDWK